MLDEDLKRRIVFGRLGPGSIKRERERSFALPTAPGFMGRGEELERLREEFPLRHIFIIEGIPGSGKTYLGAHFAHEMADRYRIFFGECRQDLGPSAILKEINNFLVSQGEAGFDLILQDVNLGKTQKIRGLINILERGRYILIFDDFHHLEDEDTKELITYFDRFFDKTRLILLTQEAPRLARELKPNNVAEIVLGGFSEDEGITYLESLLKLKDEAVLREVFRKTGGLPLALNLFASLSRYYRIEELLGTLPDYAREMINQNLIDRVFNALSEDELHMLTRFSVFRNPVSSKAFSYLCPEAGWEKVFVGLIDKLQLNREDDRVGMHPLIRQFAYERCTEKKRCHITAARYYLTLGTDLENLLEVYHHYLEAREYERASEITIRTGDELIRGGNAELAHKMIQRSLETTGDENPDLHLLLGKVLQLWGRFDEAITEYAQAYNHFTDPKKKALAQNQTGGVYLYKGDYTQAQALFKESLYLRREIDDEEGVAESLHQIGVLHLAQANYLDAAKFLEESLEITRSLEDKGALAETLNEIGRVHFYEKDYEKALSRLNEAIGLSRESGNRRAEATILHNTGSIYLETGDYTKASELFEDGLAIKEKIGDRFGLAHTLHQLGNLYLEKRDYQKAKGYFERSKIIFEELGSDDVKYPQHFLEVIEERRG